MAFAEQRLSTEVGKTDFDSLPSLVMIAKDPGVSKGFMNYRPSDLCAKYGRHRGYCGKMKYIQNVLRATEYLLSGSILSHPCAKYPSHDHLVADAMSRTGVVVHIARLAVDAALKGKLGPSAYKGYRQADGLSIPTQSLTSTRERY